MKDRIGDTEPEKQKFQNPRDTLNQETSKKKNTQ